MQLYHNRLLLICTCCAWLHTDRLALKGYKNIILKKKIKLLYKYNPGNWNCPGIMFTKFCRNTLCSCSFLLIR